MTLCFCFSVKNYQVIELMARQTTRLESRRSLQFNSTITFWRITTTKMPHSKEKYCQISFIFLVYGFSGSQIKCLKASRVCYPLSQGAASGWLFFTLQ